MQNASKRCKAPFHKKKKPRRRKPVNVDVMDRDVQIFIALVHGSAALNYLFKHFFEDSGTSRTALRTRLRELVNAQLLNSRRDYSANGQRFALFGLNMNAISFIFEASAYEIADIRRTLPNKANVSHELMVSNVYRIIGKESVSGHYKLTMKDKRMYNQDAARVNQKIKYPDLSMQITCSGNQELITLDLSICYYDNGLSALKFVHAMRRLSNPIILILCISAEDIDSLLEAFSSTADAELSHKVRLGLVADFLAHGLIGANFVDGYKRQVILFPL